MPQPKPNDAPPPPPNKGTGTSKPDMKAQVLLAFQSPPYHEIISPDDLEITCDFCGADIPGMPWHGSSDTERHIHACDACKDRLPGQHAAQVLASIKGGHSIKEFRGLRDFGARGGAHIVFDGGISLTVEVPPGPDDLNFALRAAILLERALRDLAADAADS